MSSKLLFLISSFQLKTKIDDFLNGITMYRLMLYVLAFLATAAIFLSFLKVLSFNPIGLFLSVVLLVVFCSAANTVFAKIFKVQTNLESVYITALILFLIITPVRAFEDVFFLLLAAAISQASKYLLVLNRKHIFNPAAFAVAFTAITLNKGASWWVGNTWMMLFVAIAGVLMVRKIQRTLLLFSFVVTALAMILGASLIKGNDLFSIGQRVLLDTPILFFAVVMLTEPLTSPSGKIRQIIYGGLVGSGFSFITPEIALLTGNIFSYIVSPKEKLLLALKEKVQLAPDIYDFVFGLDRKFNFLPGQYMEWTLGYQHPDSRGTRRYFTIASSPTERFLHIGVKFYPQGSSFKKSLLAQIPGSKVMAGGFSGEFTLPKDHNKKLCFIAGGIGITPFRSMVKYLLDTKQKRDIVLLYSNRSASDIVYKDIFDEASDKLGIKTVYVLTGRVGYIDAKVLQEEVPDYKDRIFYISGPHSMVDAFRNILKNLQIPANQIKVDFFPGYA